MSELIGRQSQSRTAIFRPALSDQVLARRAAATLLVLTRKALNALDTPPASSFARESQPRSCARPAAP